MKTKALTALLLSVILVLSACREITVTTTVHDDGTFTRSILVTGDSSSVFKKDLPYPVDDSWSISLIVKKDAQAYQNTYTDWEIRQDTSMEDDYRLTYRKHYENSDILNDEISNDSGWRSQLSRIIQVDKRWGLFYNYLTFTEVDSATNPFDQLDIHQYLSQQEIMLLQEAKQADKESDSLYDIAENKAMEFMIQAVYTELMDALETEIAALGDPALKDLDLSVYRDSIEKKLEEIPYDRLSEFTQYLEKLSGQEAFSRLDVSDGSALWKIDRKWELLLKLLEMEDYTQVIIMPGLLTTTNANEVVGNRVTWIVESFPLILFDQEMHAESRVVNYTGFIITGLAVVALLLLLAFKAFRM